jgi:hypothetical protein
LCGCRLEPGARIALLTTHRKIRCAACVPVRLVLDDDDTPTAQDLPVDAPEVDADGR